MIVKTVLAVVETVAVILGSFNGRSIIVRSIDM